MNCNYCTYMHWRSWTASDLLMKISDVFKGDVFLDTISLIYLDPIR